MVVFTPRVSLLGLAILMVAGIVLIYSNHQVTATKLPCQDSVPKLISKCSTYALKSKKELIKPSPAYCGVVKTVNVACLCNLVTKASEDLIEMAKVVYVADCCGNKLAPGTKCGSKLI